MWGTNSNLQPYRGSLVTTLISTLPSGSAQGTLVCIFVPLSTKHHESLNGTHEKAAASSSSSSTFSAMENNANFFERVGGRELASSDKNKPNKQNKDGTSSDSSTLNRAAATALPPSSPIAPHIELPGNYTPSSSSSLDQTPITPLRKTPSSSSLGRTERSTTPTLHKRTSMSSLQGGTPPRSPAFRRKSSNLASPNPGIGPRSPLPAALEEPAQLPVTAATIAHDFFQRELGAHHANGTALDHETIVILQDNCYGHRFSRPRTSKAGLATIVERPERIHACILGLASAYVRLGGRHEDGTVPPHPKTDTNKLSSIPFRIQKTTRTLPLTSPAATAIHGTKWMSELSVMCESAETKLALNGKELVRPATSTGGGGSSSSSSSTEQTKLHEGDLYLCSGSLSALEGALGGVCEGVDAVFAERGPKRAFVCIRPPGHHCSADYPSGFCWLNNVHVGIGHASLNHGLTHVAIVDFDLHHGDGSQSIAWDHNSRAAKLPKNAPHSKKTAIGYFSLHDINSYPCEMGDDEKVQNASLCLENAHGQSIWNVHLQPWKTEAQFWELYQDRYLILLSKARTFLRAHTQRLRSAPNHPKPKAAIFLSAGFDASEWESAGMQRHQVNVPTDFYARFTRDVVQLAEEEDLGVDGRVISVLEGGYSDRALMSGVLSHLSGLTASKITKEVNPNHSLGNKMGRRLGKLDLNGSSSQEGVPIETFGSQWWAIQQLEAVENLLNPPAPPAAPKKPRNVTQPTYTSATQSYTAKIVSSPRGRRSFSGTESNIYPSPSRPASPPPPAVDWTTAVHELAKILIPSDRQTGSCKPEELNAEASRARRDRHSIISLPPAEVPGPASNRMQLRDRRSKVPKYEEESDEEKQLPKHSRRKTIAELPILNQDLAEVPSITATPIARRLSVSSFGSDRPSEASLSSSVNQMPQQVPIVVKKTRMLSNPPSEASKARAIKKPSALSRAPSRSSVTSKPALAPPAAKTASRPVQAPLSSNEELRNKDLDELTSGLKKMAIKLKGPSKPAQGPIEVKPKPLGSARGRPRSTVPRMKKIPEASKAEVKKLAESGEIQPEKKVVDGSKDVNVTISEVLPQSISARASVVLLDTNPPKQCPTTFALPASPAQGLSAPYEPPAEDVPPQKARSSPEPPVPSFLAPTTTTIPAYDLPTSFDTSLPLSVVNPTELAPAHPSNPTSSLPDPGEIPFAAVTPLANGRPTSSSSAISSSPSSPTHKRRTKQEFVVFHPTSPIIFGKPTTLAPSIDNAIKKFEDAAATTKLDHSTTQSHVISSDTHHARQGGEVAGGGGVSDSGVIPTRLPQVEDLWAVPDTPQLLKGPMN